jgi:hypothetical protein
VRVALGRLLCLWCFWGLIGGLHAMLEDGRAARDGREESCCAKHVGV